MKNLAPYLLPAFLLLSFGNVAADTDESAPRAQPCFAPGTPPEVVEYWTNPQNGGEGQSSLAVPGQGRFRLGNRWSSTATDGGGLSQGDPTTLTWSIAPDGTTIPPRIGEPTGTSGLIAFLNGIYGSMATWLPIIEGVFDRWSELTGVTYVYEPNDDGAAFFGASGQLGVRGDVRIGGKPIDGNSGVLAYNVYPNGGDMVIDSPDSFYTNTSNGSLGFRNVLAHEHGHGLGIGHVCPVNETKLMEPFVSSAFDGPQHDDIQAGSRSYGDRFEHDDASGTAAALGSLEEGFILDDVSIDDNSDIDFYGFDIGANTAIDVTVTPIGSSYLEGPQNGDGSCTPGTSYNSENVQDLSLAVIDTDGSTVLASADLNSAGMSEVLVNVSLSSGAGTYYVEVDAVGATNNVQLFQLDIDSHADIFADGFESGDTSTWSSTAP